MFKSIIKILFIVFMFNLVFSLNAQDSTGMFFKFGYVKNKTYKYLTIKQDIVHNANDYVKDDVIDTFFTIIKVISKDKIGSIVQLSFERYNQKSELPDPIMQIPLIIALDSNNNALDLINYYDIQLRLYKEIDSLYSIGVYDSATLIRSKYTFRNKESIRSYFSKNYEDLFSLFSRQLALNINYAVGKEIFHPFSTAPFIAAGSCNVTKPNPKKEMYLLHTNIGNTESERVYLIAAYDNWMRSIGQYNPSVISPGIDVSYKNKYLWDGKSGIIHQYYQEDKLRVGDESKTSSIDMLLISEI